MLLPGWQIKHTVPLAYRQISQSLWNEAVNI
jgi:hypothetical protein